MSQKTLEDRVSALEALVARLVGKSNQKARPRNWRDSLGMFPNNEGMKEIATAGAAIREAERRAVRKERASSKRRKRSKASA